MSSVILAYSFSGTCHVSKNTNIYDIWYLDTNTLAVRLWSIRATGRKTALENCLFISAFKKKQNEPHFFLRLKLGAAMKINNEKK